MHLHLALFLTLLLAASASSAPAFAQKVRRNVEVEWDGVEGASGYEVQVVRKDDKSKKPLLFKLKESKWSATVAPGIYLMQVRSYDGRGAPGEWSPPSDLEVKLPAVIVTSPLPDQTVDASGETTEGLNLKWEPIPGAAKYKVTVKSTTNDWKDEREVSQNSVRVEIPVGQTVEWNVQAVDPKGIEGDISSSAYKFELKGPALQRPKIEKPISKYLREVNWGAPNHASKYAYELKYYNPTAKKWEVVDKKSDYKETKVDLDIQRPSGKYRLAVQAYGERRKPSPPVQMDFETRGGFRDPAALDKAILRDSLTKPTHFYAITSYMVTQIEYEGTDYDELSRSSFPAVGGTGRIGMGYQDPESNWGGFGIADLSGFIIQGQNFKFASVEGHATRKLELGQNGILLAAGGLFAKELPVVKGNITDGYSSTTKVRNIGPHAGFVYWFPFNDRWGLQMNARAYYTLMGSSSTGAKVTSSLSYQYGLLGSRRLTQSWMGYAGYAFRHDEANYATTPGTNSFATDGQVNNVTIQGHYLNLMLEFSF
ncbi:MAG: hypothetical protein KF799_15325 [Bdellovibrionales bacterium]|nr:hypothetical protein [Bdellovibrionales bacterium]